MSFNFSELQQKADRVIHNADEAVRGLSRLATDSNPVQIQLYDQDGNLITHNVETIPMQQAKVDSFIANARGEYPVVNAFNWTKDPSLGGTHLWYDDGGAGGTASFGTKRAKDATDVSLGLLQEYNYHPSNIQIQPVTYTSASNPMQFAFPVAIGLSLFKLSGYVTFQYFYRYISHSGQLPDMSFLDDANTWTDGKWHFQRHIILATANPYKAWWLATPTLPPNSSLTIEVCCIQAILGKPENIDRYVDPITL